MKQKIYLRIGKGKKGMLVSAHKKPNYEPHNNGYHYQRKHFPTVLIALEINIPDKEFEASRILLEANIEKTTPAVEIKQVKP